MTPLPGDYVQDRYPHMTQEGLEKNGYPGARCLWTITTGRSGTVWLNNTMGQLGGFVSAHEPYPSMFYEGRQHMEGNCMGAGCARMIRGMRGTLVRSAHYKQLCYVECSHLLSHMAECILEAFPASKFLHLVRDPREFVSSALPRKWMDYATVNSHWWPRTVPYERPWERLVWHWNEVHSKGLELEAKLGDAVMRVTSRDLWADPEKLCDVSRFAGHSQPGFIIGACHDAVQKGAANAGKPKPWSKARDPFLRMVAGNTMDALGIA